MIKKFFSFKTLAFLFLVFLLFLGATIVRYKIISVVAPVLTGKKSQFQALPSPTPTKSLCPIPAIKEGDYVWEGTIESKDNKWLAISLDSNKRVVVASYSAETVFVKVENTTDKINGLGKCLTVGDIKSGDKITAYGVIKDKLFTAHRVDIVGKKE